MAKTLLQLHEEAEFLRKSSGSTNIEKTLLKALSVLKLFDIPHFVCGGFAVQERGYARFTVDLLMPSEVSDEPQILSLDKLILAKLSNTWGAALLAARISPMSSSLWR